MLSIYAKGPEDKKFYPMDYQEGTTVDRLIYATMWENEERGHVQGLIDAMTGMNPGFTFEIRKRG